MTEKEFESASFEWNALLAKSYNNDFFLSWEWINSWWQIFKENNKSLFLLCGKDKTGQLIGIAPFYIENLKFCWLVQRKIVRFCSSTDLSPDHLDVICDKHYIDYFPKALLKYLREMNDEWTEFQLTGLRENSIIRHTISLIQMDDQNCFIKDSRDSECPYLALHGSFDQLLKSFSSKKRNTLQRKRNKLLIEDGYKFYVFGSELGDSNVYLSRLFQLHTGRAKRTRKSSSFSNAKSYHFHQLLCSRIQKHNYLVLTALSKDTECIAVYYAFRYNRKYYYYQTGLSHKGELKSAGTVLLSLTIEKALFENCREFDFLRGGEKYKYFWTHDKRYNRAIIIFKKTFINFIIYYATTLKEKVSALMDKPARIFPKQQ